MWPEEKLIQDSAYESSCGLYC